MVRFEDKKAELVKKISDLTAMDKLLWNEEVGALGKSTYYTTEYKGMLLGSTINALSVTHLAKFAVLSEENSKLHDLIGRRIGANAVPSEEEALVDELLKD